MGRFVLPDRALDVRAEKGTRITAAAAAAGVYLNVKCGSSGLCGGCAVDLVEGTFDLDGREVAPAGRPRRVLGCRARIGAEPWSVRIPRRSISEEGEPIAASAPPSVASGRSGPTRRLSVRFDTASGREPRGDREVLVEALERGLGLGRVELPLSVARSLPEFSRLDAPCVVTVGASDGAWRVVRIEREADRGAMFGLAVDIGTTTVAVALVDLETGQSLRTAAGYNHQSRCGADVATRISHAMRPGGTEELNRWIVEETLNPLVSLLCRRHDASPDSIARVAVAGNTAMGHLFLGISPKNLGTLPFNAAVLEPVPVAAWEVGLAAQPEALVDVLPGASAYVGGDVVGGVAASGLLDEAEPCALLDIGTNAEIVLRTRGRLLACATPAGPAFEGGGLVCGMRAAMGAIEKVAAGGDGAMKIGVIGDDPPCGICGSGYVDFLAEARRIGGVGRSGRFLRGKRRGGASPSNGRGLSWRLSGPAEGGGDPVEVTECDVAEIMKAKAAVYSGLITLLRHAKLEPGDLRRVFLAGGFAQYLRLSSAVGIGMIPDIPLDRFSVVGNSALGGAYLALVDADARRRMGEIAGRIEVIELNLDPDFEDEYLQALYLPHLDPARFPRVEAQLEFSAAPCA